MISLTLLLERTSTLRMFFSIIVNENIFQLNLLEYLSLFTLNFAWRAKNMDVINLNVCVKVIRYVLVNHRIPKLNLVI